METNFPSGTQFSNVTNAVAPHVTVLARERLAARTPLLLRDTHMATTIGVC